MHEDEVDGLPWRPESKGEAGGQKGGKLGEWWYFSLYGGGEERMMQGERRGGNGECEALGHGLKGGRRQRVLAGIAATRSRFSWLTQCSALARWDLTATGCSRTAGCSALECHFDGEERARTGEKRRKNNSVG